MFGFQWHLTDRCNLRCRHCYQSEFTPASEAGGAARRMMADAIFGAMPKEPVDINLTGGEPLLLPDLTDLLLHLHGFPNLDEVHLITNATVDDPTLCERLRQFPKLGFFKVSCESGDEAVNDAIRGPGNLATLRRTIPLLRERTGKRVILMITLARYNVGTIPATVEFARSVGATGIIFERFVPLGQSGSMTQEVMTAGDWRSAIVAIGQVSGTETDPDSVAECRAFWLWFDRPAPDNLDAALCNLGADSMALMPDGTVFPCRRLAIPVGNVLQEPFPVIRARLAEWDPKRLRPRLKGDLCGTCLYEDCPGCRALARAMTGDPLADDPQCVLQD